MIFELQLTFIEHSIFVFLFTAGSVRAAGGILLMINAIGRDYSKLKQKI